MSDLFGKHIVGFPTRRLICDNGLLHESSRPGHYRQRHGTSCVLEYFNSFGMCHLVQTGTVNTENQITAPITENKTVICIDKIEISIDKNENWDFIEKICNILEQTNKDQRRYFKVLSFLYKE